MAQQSFQSIRISAFIHKTRRRSKTASRKYKLLKGCATVIQKNWRSYAQRKSYQQKRQAAVVLQKYIKRHQAIKAKNCQLNAAKTSGGCSSSEIHKTSSSNKSQKL